jgi:cell fate regulator YaaT (PSP1 superfamily)
LGKYLATYGKPRFLGIVEFDDEAGDTLASDGMIVAVSHRGEEAASVMGPLNEEQELEYRGMRTTAERGEGPSRGGDPVVSDLDFVRPMSDEDRGKWATQKDSEAGILKDALEMAGSHHLAIKLIDAETMMDGKKLFFYFTSETRVDFRNLVKDMARKFRTRIELRQMGVRDEARIVRGMASCGLPCCCSYWLNQFAPIGIKMVKEQNIALNPAKISGICGRLMCCMSFEHKVYKNLWAGLPGPGSKIKTPNGNYIVTAMDISREAVRCHKPTGGDIVVPIGSFQDFRHAVMNGEEWELPASEREAEDERAARHKTECACRRHMEYKGSGIVIAEKPREGVYDVFEPPKTPRDATSAGEAGSSEVSDRHQGRRRGRRGRRHRPESEEAARPATEIRAEHPHRPRQEPPTPVKDAPETGDASARTSRPRHRRRRPRRDSGSAAEN